MREPGSSDRICIKGIRCRCRIGVPELEREELQELRIDVGLELDFSKAVSGDDFTHTVDYEQIVETIQFTAQSHSYSLVETLANSLVMALMKDSRIESVQIVVRKYPNVLLDHIDHVAIEMFRSRENKEP